MPYSSADSLELKLSVLGRDFRLSRNFKLHEFACKDGTDTVLIHPALIVAMQRIRDEIGQPLTINSGFRTVAHNDAIGGAPKSFHLYGMAVDLSGVEPDRIFKVASKLGYTARKYSTFCHVDIGEYRIW